MTPGTSPRPLGSPCFGWTQAAACIRNTAAAWAADLSDMGRTRAWLARAASALYLGALGILLTTAWQDPSAAVGGGLAGLAAWHAAFLMATGAAAALFTLVGREPPAAAAPRAAPTGLDELMAQMSHELRTPLNAVIGFSDVMLHELHGPLGHARYQEYAHHISESGGRLLKSSQDALAVTEAMSALMADRVQGRRERLVAGPLLREAWRVAAGDAKAFPRLTLTTCNACDLLCERRPTLQAFEQLLREAVIRAPAGAAIEVQGRRQGGRRNLEVRVAPMGLSEGAVAADADHSGMRKGADPQARNLRVILARLLLETQGATLTCAVGVDGSWSALVEFPKAGP